MIETAIERLFNFDIKDCRFMQLPQRKTIFDYERAQEEFISYYRRVKGVCSIYRFGSVSVYGLSDLDFLVVLDDGYKHHYGTRYDTGYFSADAQYILLHPQFFISRSLMCNIQTLYLVRSLERIWGEDIAIESYNMKESGLKKILIWFDSFILCFPFILKFLLERKINVRQTFSKLNLLKHFIDFLHDIAAIQKEKFTDYLYEVEELRQSWFKSKREDNLSQLILCMKKWVKTAYYLFSELNNFLELNSYNIYQENLLDGGVELKHKETIMRFEKEWDPDSSLNKTVEIFSKTKKYVHFLPLNFSFHLFQYIKTGGKFGNFIDKQLFLKPERSFVVDGYLPAKKRAEYINKHIKFLEDKKIIGCGTFKYLGYGHSGKKLRGEYRYSNYQRWAVEKLQRFKLVFNKS